MRTWPLIIALLISSCAPSLHTIQSRIAREPARGRLLSVPFIAQEEFYCGPASLAMAINYYGCSITQDEIAARYFKNEVGGLFTVDMIAAARDLGFEPGQGAGTWEMLKQAISEGDPVIVFWNWAAEPLPLRHFAVVVGYYSTGQKDWVIVHSGSHQNLVISRGRFERLWFWEDNWMMTIEPGLEACKWQSP
jgi:ABC-type bacteriocin/lantibiotic exporter with double-glycine peptidase domain